MTVAEINQGLNISFNTLSEAIAPLVIADNQWNQISLPLLPPVGQNTVEAVFADDISGEYGEDWALFAYDANSNQYFSPDLGDTVTIGTGYWIIQATGQDVTIDLPERSTYPSLVYSTQCSSINGCFEVALATQTDDIQWSMLGHSFTQQTNWSDLRVTTTGDACNGCTINEAESENIFHNQAWHYNPTTNQYEPIENTMPLNSWDGFWNLTLSSAEGTNPKLLIPNQ